jgi:hypothetical protein
MTLIRKSDVTRNVHNRSPLAQEFLRRLYPNLCQIGMGRKTYVSPKCSHQVKTAKLCDFGQILNADVFPVVPMEIVFDAEDLVPLVTNMLRR